MKRTKKRYNEFVFRFDVYDGSEDSNEVYDAQVVQYEFINAGNSLVVINDGLFLYPRFAGIAPDSIKFDINDCEMDVTVYKYKFLPLDRIVKEFIFSPAPGTELVVPFPGVWMVPEGELAKQYNKLTVVSKVKATVETHNP